MGHKFKSKVIAGDRAVFYRDVATVQSGFNLAQEFPIGTEIPRGAFVDFVEEDKNEAYIVKSAGVVAGGTSSAIRVEKGNLFQKGDKVFVDKSGEAKITSIDASEAEYDVLNVSPALQVEAGDVLREVGYTKIKECTVTLSSEAVTVPESSGLAVGDLVRKKGTVSPVKVATVASASDVSTITFDSAIKGLANGDVLEIVERSDLHEPMGCLYKPLIVKDDAETVDVVIKGRVYARRIQAIHQDWFGGNRRLFLKNNPAITFTYSL